MKINSNIWKDIKWLSWDNKMKKWKEVSDFTDNVVKNTDIIRNATLSQEKQDAITEHLSEKQKEAIWWEFLLLESMTVSKITVIGFMLSDTEITEIWPDKLAKISMEELNILTQEYM